MMLKGIMMHTISSASGCAAGSRSRSSKREDDNHSGRIVDVSTASKGDHDDYDEDEHDESETDRDTVDDLEMPRIPQDIEILDDGVTSTVTPITFDFNSFAHRPYGGGGRERGDGIAADHHRAEDGPLFSKRQIGVGILCLLCIAVIAFITPFLLTRDVGGSESPSANASLPAVQDETSDISSSVPADTPNNMYITTAPSLAPIPTKSPGDGRPVTRPDELSSPVEPPTTRPSAAVATTDTTGSPATLAPRTATPSVTPSEMKYWMGVAWSPCRNGSTSMILTCEDGYPLTVYRFTEETTLCKAVNATTQQCHQMEDADGNDIVAAALVSCPSRIRVEIPVCDDLLFISTTTNYCDGSWHTWNSTSCADKRQSGNATSLLQLLTDEQSNLSLVNEITDALQNALVEGNPQELALCYSRGQCASNSVNCTAPPIRAEAIPQKVCSGFATTNAGDDELDLAWTALDDIVAWFGKS